VGSLAFIPTWVAPPAQQVVDCFRICYAVVDETLSFLRGGHAAAVNWVTGGQVSPISEVPEQPVPEHVARAERMLARVVAWDMPPPSLTEWADLGVEPREPVASNREWATGVEAALSWLLGLRAEPAVRLPRRLPDGSTPTAEQLYAEMVAAEPYAYDLPEERRDGRNKAAADAALYRRLAALAASAW